MGRYMEVQLKKEYISDSFIIRVNALLNERFNANDPDIFVSEAFLKEEAKFFNSDPEGLKQIPHFKRPITPTFLKNNFIWYRPGYYQFKLSGCPEAEEAINAVAVCQWIQNTRHSYIDSDESSNFQPKILHQYLDCQFRERGYDLEKIWELNTK